MSRSRGRGVNGSIRHSGDCLGSGFESRRIHREMITSVEVLPGTYDRLKLYVVNIGRVSWPDALARLARRVHVGDRVLLSGYSFERTNKRITGSNWK